MRIASLLLLLLCPAQAHELHEPTARVTLRSGHAEVRLRLDMLDAMGRIGEPGVPIAHLPAVDPTGFAALAAKTRAQLAAETVLWVEGRRVPLALTAFPRTEALVELARQQAMQKLVDPHAHAPRWEVRLEVRLKARPAEVALELPKALGPMMVTFVEPTITRATPGHPSRYRLGRVERHARR